MGLIAKKVETNPLDGMKHDQGDPKKQEVNKGKRIGEDLLHDTAKINETCQVFKT